MSILNVNTIQPVGSGQTITVSAADISAPSTVVTASSFVGNVTGGSLSGISTLGVTTAYVSQLAGVGAGTSIQVPSGSKLVGLSTGSVYAPGTILQVVSTTKTDTTSTTSGSFVDATGLSVTITPSNVSNKILVMFNVYTSHRPRNYNVFLRLMRDSTAIAIGDAASTRPRITGEFATPEYSGNATYESAMGVVSFTHLDSPSSTSAITYKIQFSSAGGLAGYINRTDADRDAGTYDPRAASSITVMEVAA